MFRSLIIALDPDSTMDIRLYYSVSEIGVTYTSNAHYFNVTGNDTLAFLILPDIVAMSGNLEAYNIQQKNVCISSTTL